MYTLRLPPGSRPSWERVVIPSLLAPQTLVWPSKPTSPPPFQQWQYLWCDVYGKLAFVIVLLNDIVNYMSQSLGFRYTLTILNIATKNW